jgi:hypothetical protein
MIILYADMASMPPAVYVRGMLSEASAPLGRYLPLLPPGVTRTWLERLAPLNKGGTWLIDPLGASPQAALEAARAGYRVIVIANNPVLAFMLDVLASAPRYADFQAALAAFAATRRGEERLEVHLRSLYQTTCAACGADITALSFLWRRGETAPYARLYHCPACHDEGERPIQPDDLERMERVGKDSLHRSRALARVAQSEDEHYPAVQEALDAYLPRPLYALQTLINKSEGAGISPAQQRLLRALLLSACDAAGTLWPIQSARSRPRQLAVPAAFRENNLWLALEDAALSWSSQGAGVPFTHWPDLPPPEGGITLFAGRVKGLSALPEGLRPSAAFAAFPRPNQAFWTFSVLWAGWLWGREAALPLHSFLSRRRFDWNWHTTAMHSPLFSLARLLPPGVPVLGMLSELVPGFLAALLAAASGAGLALDGLALRGEEELAQVVWRAGANETRKAEPAGAQAPEQIFAAALKAHLEERAEPADYLPLYAAGLSALAGQNKLAEVSAQLPGDLHTRIQTLSARVFADRRLLRRFDTGSQEEERSLWWLSTPSSSGTDAVLPLADRIEMETVRQLQKSPGLTRFALDGFLCQAFPGLLTPSTEFIDAVLESYAEEIPGSPGQWRLLAQEGAASRRADLETVRGMLRQIGQRMGYTISGETPLIWTPGSFGQVYFFYCVASSIVSKHVLAGLPGPSSQIVMVFPGGRARLLSLKFKRDPRLAERIKGIHLLKFRHLRALYERETLTPDQWDGLLDADPPFFEEAEQMRLL